jgi:hypothetical protein
MGVRCHRGHRAVCRCFRPPTAPGELGAPVLHPHRHQLDNAILRRPQQHQLYCVRPAVFLEYTTFALLGRLPIF